MIKILVVEDQPEKRREIIGYLTSLDGIELSNDVRNVDAIRREVVDGHLRDAPVGRVAGGHCLERAEGRGRHEPRLRDRGMRCARGTDLRADGTAAGWGRRRLNGRERASQAFA